MSEETLTYNTPNSEEILTKIHQYEFKRIWKNYLSKNKRNLFWGITFLLLAAFMLFYKESFGYFFLGCGLMYLVSFFKYISTYKKHKKTFTTLLDYEIKNLKTNSNNVIWEFTPTYFKFQNYKADFKFYWDSITHSILDEQYLYITASPYMNFILDKANIDETNFNKTLDYLKDKSHIKTI
jgi:hypothetical protein